MDWNAFAKAKEFWKEEKDNSVLLSLMADYERESVYALKECNSDRYEEKNTNAFAIRMVLLDRLNEADKLKNAETPEEKKEETP